MIEDCAVYRSGRRLPGDLWIKEAAEASAAPDSFAWVALVEPTDDELDRVRAAFGLDAHALGNVVRNQGRPRMAIVDNVLYAVFKTAEYVADEQRVALGSLVVVAAPTCFVSARYGRAGDLSSTRKELDADPRLLQTNGTCSATYAAVDRLVDEFVPVLDGLDAALREIEHVVFSPVVAEHSEPIYRLKREVLEFRRATAPVADMMLHLAAGRFPPVPQVVRDHYGNVEDRLMRVAEEIERVNALLSSMLDANSAQVGMRQAQLALEQTDIATQQNSDMRKISAWVAIAAVPTAIAGIYGMNFEAMPELRWPFGYPLVLLVMLVLCLVLLWLFRRSKWL
ncbi:magnesium and cobalt transport protein CorA [Pseudonocardia sp. CA-107938]|uniref:magnesium and cobalt transport protein CorA n=1 Tax=Pseudonocardia sp. CA-107938 TaxID=3240021 RepID=UPI003D905A43